MTAEGHCGERPEKVAMIEQMGYDNLVISIKSSDVLMCVKAHELISKRRIIRSMWALPSPVP